MFNFFKSTFSGCFDFKIVASDANALKGTLWQMAVKDGFSWGSKIS